MKIRKCPECGSIDLEIKHDLGECICRSCGLLLDDSMFEVNPYSEQHTKTNALNIAGTSSVDGRIVKSAWLLSNKEKNFQKAKTIIELASSRLNLPEYVVNDTEKMYVNTIDKRLSVGRSVESIVLACIYISCLQNNIPKIITEIIKNSSIKKRDFNNSLKAIKKEFNLKLDSVSTLDLLDKYMNQLRFNFEAREYALGLYEKTKNKAILQGKNQKTIASAIIYITSRKLNLGISQRKIAHTVDIFETTIRRACKEVLKLNEKIN